mmetsp:Transcript_7545/g.23851  ORF Transcript_7545/g.23851 Transcript_7545/m.23851 type:complete len:208 (+) Transcript_7545:116-739(+)
MDRPLAMSVMTFPGTVDQRLAGRPRPPAARGPTWTGVSTDASEKEFEVEEARRSRAEVAPYPWASSSGRTTARWSSSAARSTTRRYEQGGPTFSRHREEEGYMYTVVVRCNTTDEIFMAAQATFTALRVSVGGFQKLLASLQSINEGADGEEELLDRFMDTIDDETEFQYWFEKTMPLVMNTVGTVLAEETTVQGRAAAPSEQGSSP